MYDTGMKPIDAAVGYAADDAGNGVAYVRIASQSGGERAARVMRVAFNAVRHAALQDREIGYAALTTICETLLRRGVDRVRFFVDDAQLVADLHERDEIPSALALPYVRLGCALNRFRRYEIAALPASDADLTARARSEVALHVAA